MEGLREGAIGRCLNFSVQKGHQDSFERTQLPEFHRIVSDSMVGGRGGDFAFLTSSQGMLIMLPVRPPFEQPRNKLEQHPGSCFSAQWRIRRLPPELLSSETLPNTHKSTETGPLEG